MSLSRLFLWTSSAIASVTFVGAVIAGYRITSENRGKDDDAMKAELLVLEALEKFEQGDTNGSRSLTERVLAISPAQPLARANLGRIYKGQGDYARAIAEHKLALANAPELPDLYYNVACYYALSKRKEDALRWLALAIDHGFARLEHLRGDADLDSLQGDPRFDLLARTGKLATGVPRVRLHPAAGRVLAGDPFEVSIVVEREVPEADAGDAARSLEVTWVPDEPLKVISSNLSTTAVPGDGYVTLRTVGRWVVAVDEEGIFALPAARAMATIDGETVVVMSEAFAVEVASQKALDATPDEGDGIADPRGTPRDPQEEGGK